MQNSSFTFGTSVRRAVMAGILAGVCTALFVGVIGEPSIDAAIAIEEAAADVGSDAEDPLFSRGTQVIGGLSAAVLYGLLVGVIFGTVFAAVRHKLTVGNDFRRSVLLAVMGFTTTALIPALKYPANPPAVGDPDTVNQRTIAYLTLVAGAIGFAVAVATFYRWMRQRQDQATATVATSVLGLAAVSFLLIAWPGNPDTISAEFPADLLWEFRLQSLASLTILWSVMGLAFGWLNRSKAVIDLRTPVTDTANAASNTANAASNTANAASNTANAASDTANAASATDQKISQSTQ